jgi:hypothetical protein
MSEGVTGVGFGDFDERRESSEERTVWSVDAIFCFIRVGV